MPVAALPFTPLAQACWTLKRQRKQAILVTNKPWRSLQLLKTPFVFRRGDDEGSGRLSYSAAEGRGCMSFAKCSPLDHDSVQENCAGPPLAPVARAWAASLTRLKAAGLASGRFCLRRFGLAAEQGREEALCPEALPEGGRGEDFHL